MDVNKFNLNPFSSRQINCPEIGTGNFENQVNALSPSVHASPVKSVVADPL